jgi:uncharacterized protein (TIGR03084 family)
MPADLPALCADLLSETADVEQLVSPLDATGWATPTPAVGWTILDQVAHLAFFDRQAHLAATEPDRFRAERALLRPDDEPSRTGAETLDWLTRERRRFVDAVAPLDGSARVPWYGPDMSLASSITARIMETWAHGVDIHDALGVAVTSSPRLAHVAFIGARALANSFVANGLEVPELPVRLELVAASGEPWIHGPSSATDRIEGSLLDFCLVAVRRRHRDDTSLRATGTVADRWLSIAQAFAGPPGPDPVRR